MVECLDASDLEVLSSPLQTYFSDLHSWLDESPFQVVLAGVALVAGLFSLWDGMGSWRRLFIVCAMAGSASVARYEAKEWSLDLVSEVMLMVQASFSIALAAHVGFSGFQVLFGAIMGFLGAYSCGGWARNLHDQAPSLAFFWYLLGTVFGILVFVIWRKPVLASAAPLFGGLLVSSSVCWLLSWGGAALHGGQGLPILPPGRLPYLDAAEALIDPAGPAALAGHGACTLLAAVIHGGADSRRPPAILCLVSCIIVTTLASATGFAMGDSGGETRWWSVFGCLLWGPLAAAAAWFQMGQIDKDDGVDLQRDIYASVDSISSSIQDRLPDRLPGSSNGRGLSPTARGLSPTARAFHGYASSGSGGSGGGLRGVLGFGRASASNAVRASDEGTYRASEDAPGRYVINQDPTYVSPSSVVPMYDDEITDELRTGEVVSVLEVRRTEDRVRARIKDPPGWISLVNLESGVRFATRA